MTHPKPPIEQAVAALEEGANLLDECTQKHDAGFYEEAHTMRAAAKALRASTGHAKEIPLKAVDLVDAIRKAETIEAAGVLMADYLLAAAQPEPRPLREFIAEGCDLFWVYKMMDGGPVIAWTEHHGKPNEYLVVHGEPRKKFRTEHYLNCHAIPIWKPKNV